MHSSLSLRRLAVFLLLCAFALPLAGCGDKEPEQRAAFIGILENNIVGKPGLSVAALSAEEQKKIGDYAKHYQVLADFHAAMNRDVGPELTAVTKMMDIKSLNQAVENRETLVKARKTAGEIKKKVTDQLAKTDAARAALKQPDDLKAVYNKAYEKSVSRPAGAFVAAFDKVDDLLGAATSLVDFIKAHQDGLSVSGQTVQVRDAALQPGLDARLKAVTESTQALLAAYKDLSAVTK